MTHACPVPTPAQLQYGEIQHRIETEMMLKVHAAIQVATEQARSEMQAAGLDIPPPSTGYFAATIHQRLYCTLCHADPTDFSGGRADIALAIIRNSQNIAKHHWGADIEIAS